MEAEEGSRMRLSQKTVRADFVKKIEEITGQSIYLCYQCGRCTSGCPFAHVMDYPPSAVIRMIQLGDQRVFRAESVWFCSTCFVCSVRCPKGVKVAETMDAVRVIVARKQQSMLTADTLSHENLEDIPPIALVSTFRKYTG